MNSRLPSCPMLTAVTCQGWLTVRWHSRTRESHSRALRSSEAEAHVVTSREGQKEFTMSACPLYWRTRAPVRASHIAAVLSADALKAYSPSDAHCTSRTELEWPLKLALSTTN